MLIIPTVLLVCGFILAGVLLASSPGKPESFLDKDGRPLNGSISEKIYLNINGVQQGMFIMSKDVIDDLKSSNMTTLTAKHVFQVGKALYERDQ